ncbi:DNA-directed RNA polymerase I complex subunit Ker1 [Schizosaccharomyces cryophilus OY26]|uniref:DNA-directed RNA polymerase I complex subunit Ker1 n=1 Tax=Schizosaccharomyces cryophilus (strain OY26 / ATCC MYA-4695 / CBS 11777 / NBRC 106824 / NRRL Y48691) TaxID=653667 RepID=S9XJC8_SCHCR|nr:DNA-directed RNA polymerase I complex subunit Ker1 [Schizosaccharomyces cryophilus OY26]EPY53751.1 DNA-directed RNA polymerase I complex subunit Ker1 [Schizosaccharomyces cryophilus OY26]
MATDCPPTIALRKTEKLSKDKSLNFLEGYVGKIEQFQDEKSGSESVLSQLNRVLMYLRGEDVPLLVNNPVDETPSTKELGEETVNKPEEKTSKKHGREEDMSLSKEERKRLKKEQKKSARREKEESRKAGQEKETEKDEGNEDSQ